MRVLVVEDDAKIAEFVARGLKEAGYAVDAVHDGETGLDLALRTPYDAAVIDLMLPGLDGLSLIETLRQKKIKTPVLILSARRSVDDRVKGLQRGGDDYMTKPFSFSELLARVQALIRRYHDTAEPTTLEACGLTMNLVTREVERDGKPIQLQPREFALLEHFIRHPGRIISKTAILEHIYDYSFHPQTNVVDVLVCRLRAKVDRGFERSVIQTIRGAGYVLREEP